MKGVLGDLMRQAQRVQEDMQRAQEELGRTECTGEAGAGLVKVVMTGRRDVRKVSIAPELLQEDLSMLEDLLAAAVNDANRKVEEHMSQSMGGMMGGLKIPGM